MSVVFTLKWGIFPSMSQMPHLISFVALNFLIFILIWHQIVMLTRVCFITINIIASGQGSRSSAGEYQADEQAVVARLSWRVSGR